MGKIRLVQLGKTLTEEEFKVIANVLDEAFNQCESFDFYWNLEPEEDRKLVRAKFEHVAKKREIPLVIRSLRKENKLHLTFSQEDTTLKGRKLRLSLYKKKVLQLLRLNGGPMSKKDILKRGSLSPSYWHSASMALKEEGLLDSSGNTRGLFYRLTEWDPE